MYETYEDNAVQLDEVVRAFEKLDMLILMDQNKQALQQEVVNQAKKEKVEPSLLVANPHSTSITLRDHSSSIPFCFNPILL